MSSADRPAAPDLPASPDLPDLSDLSASPGPRFAPQPTLAALRAKDLPTCADLEQRLFAGDDPWGPGAFAAELAQGHYYLGAYLPDGALIGYAGLAVLGRPPYAEAEVHTIGVHPAWQGKGVGRRLLRALLERADSVSAPTFLEVRTDNDPAIALYESHGFEVVGLRKKYYQPSGADAYTMRRPAESADLAAPDGDPRNG